MKVLVISHVDNLSGANKSLLSIINDLGSKAEFTVLTNGKSSEFSNAIERSNAKVIYADYGWWYGKPRKNIIKHIYRYIVDFINYYYKRNINKDLLHKLKQEKYDLVYTNTSTVDIGIRLSKKLKIPHVWHIREFGYEDFGFSYLVKKSYIKKCLNKSEAIITISEAIRNKYRKNIDETKIHLVYNGFQIEELCVAPKVHNLKDKINILIAGQVCEAKGQEQAIAAVDLLNKKGRNIRLFIAGDVDQDYLNSIFKKYDKKEFVEVLGKVDNLKELRDKVDIELVCSRCEAFGRVTIEAMLHGIPVVGANSGGTAELIKDGITGMLYTYNDVGELANKIELLIDDKDIYNSISEEAYIFAKNFTIQNTTEQVYEIFKEVIKNNGEMNEE